MFLFILLILNNFGGVRFAGAQLVVNGVLLVWAAGNLVVTVLLVRGYRSGPQFGLATHRAHPAGLHGPPPARA